MFDSTSGVSTIDLKADGKLKLDDGGPADSGSAPEPVAETGNTVGCLDPV